MDASGCGQEIGQVLSYGETQAVDEDGVRRGLITPHVREADVIFLELNVFKLATDRRLLLVGDNTKDSNSSLRLIKWRVDESVSFKHASVLIGYQDQSLLPQFSCGLMICRQTLTAAERVDNHSNSHLSSLVKE